MYIFQSINVHELWTLTDASRLKADRAQACGETHRRVFVLPLRLHPSLVALLLLLLFLLVVSKASRVDLQDGVEAL